MNLKQLLQAKTEKLDAAKAINAKAEGEKRRLTAEEGATFDALMAEVGGLNADIKRAEALAEEERKMPAVGAARAELPNEAKKPWASLGEQLKAIQVAKTTNSRVIDARLMAALGANETVEAEGGFLVAPEFAQGILQRTYDTGEVVKRCMDMPMASNRLVMNAVDEDSRVDGSRWGGIESYWLAEAGTYNGTKPKFKQLQFTANKMVGLAYVTEEQLEDAVALESYINQVFPDEFAFRIDDAIINGLGAGQPLGVITAGAAYTVSYESGQGASKTIVTANILKMWQHMWGPSRKNAVWFINQDVEQQLYTLAFANPTGAVLFTGPMYTPPGVNGNNSGYGLLMGRPVVPIEQAASLGTIGDVILFDGSQYIVTKKGGMRADSSIHVAFLTGEQAFRFQLRLDGQPTWKKPLTPKNGTNLLSPFVVLQNNH